ncbi:MAG: GAF domain-containing sensor histidine kinase [Thermomicrobiales bacterium]
MADPRTERLLTGQNQVLRMLALGQSLSAMFDTLCHALEGIMPGSACSVLLLDTERGELRHAATPSLPAAYAERVDGVVIGPMVGCCGTAAWFNQTVVAPDIASDPRWADWKDLAAEFGLCACWSVPIRDWQMNQVLGTFAVYYREPRAPSVDDLAVVEQWADLAGVAILHARRQEALRQARDVAEAADRAKSVFLAMANHELRAPLQVILGYTELLLGDRQAPLTDEQRSDLATIYDGGRRMARIIDDLVDLARVDTNSLALRRERVDLLRLVDQVYQEMAPQARQRGLELRVVPPGTSPALVGDADRLRQILLNLVGNAVKFTHTGFVEIVVAVAGDHVEVMVHDTGVGIAPEELPHIFEVFRQVDHPLTRQNTGAGLGLAIAQRLAALMDGQILVESVPGDGSIFTLRLPLAAAPH